MHHLRSNFNEGSLTCPSFTEITMVSSEYSDAYAFSIINGYFAYSKISNFRNVFYDELYA